MLQSWNLGAALDQVAAFPQRLSVRSAASGDALARMDLGAVALERYGAPYATLHRADLHRLLLEGARSEGVELLLDARVGAVREGADCVLVGISGAAVETEAQALVGADGLWSDVRRQLWADGAPMPTGHLAYRTLIFCIVSLLMLAFTLAVYPWIPNDPSSTATIAFVAVPFDLYIGSFVLIAGGLSLASFFGRQRKNGKQ